MDLAEEAFRLVRKGENDASRRLFREALSFETKAAALLPPSEESEPSRSILYRSAASLAFNAGDYETAERLVAQGLSGFPPAEIKQELKSLHNDIDRKHQPQTQRTVGMYQPQTQRAVGMYVQESINYGQARINYELVQVDKRLIEVLRVLLNLLKGVNELPHLKGDLSMVEPVIAEANEIVNRIAEISPPGAEPPDPPHSS